MNIFPEQTLSETEETIIAEKLSDPAVQKYLHLLAYNVGKGILLSAPGAGQTDEQYLRSLANAQGQLSTLNTLLSFESAKQNG